MTETRSAVASTRYDDAEGVVSLAFVNGKSVTVDANKLPEAVANALLLRGIAMTLRNSFQKIDDIDAVAHAAALCAADMLSGKWKPGRTFGESAPTDLERALAEAKKCSINHVRDTWLPQYLENHTTADRGGRQRGKGAAMEALQRHPQVAPLLARYAAERAQAARGAGGKGIPSLDELSPSPSAEAAE